MHLQAIINQLEKALESDKADELRMRVEVLLEFLKDIPAPTPAPAPNLSPVPRPTSAAPIPTDNKAQVNKVTNLVNYTRPKGT